MNNERNNITIIDWLQVNFKASILQNIEKGNIIKLDSNSYIKITGKNSAIWNNIDELYINNQFVGMITYNTNAKISKYNNLKKDDLKLKFDNIHLYTGEWLDFFIYIVNRLKWTYISIHQFDIANDSYGNDLIKFMNKYLYKNNHKIKFNSHANIQQIKNLKNPEQPFHIGSLKSDKQITIYNKTKELENSNKQYIRDFWKENNLDHNNNQIERFELTLKGNNTENVNIYMLLDENYLNQILQSHCINYYQFSKKTKNRKGKVINKDVTPIRFKTVNQTINYIRPEQIKKESNSLFSKKITIHSLFNDYLMTNNNIIKNKLLDAINIQIANNEYLEDWYYKHISLWIEDFEKNNKNLTA